MAIRVSRAEKMAQNTEITSIMADLDLIDYENKHYRRRKADLEERLYITYDKIEKMEVSLAAAKAKKGLFCLTKFPATISTKHWCFLIECMIE